MPFFVVTGSNDALYNYGNFGLPQSGAPRASYWDEEWRNNENEDSGSNYPSRLLFLEYTGVVAIRLRQLRTDIAPLFGNPAGGAVSGESRFREPRWCGDNLPQGWRWNGAYYFVREGRQTQFHPSMTRWTCPHCALVWQEQQGITGYILAWCPEDVSQEEFTNFVRGNVPAGEIIGQPDNLEYETIKVTEWATASACSNCGRLGHRQPACTNPRKAHDRVGIEIEGFWYDRREAQRRASGLGMSGYHDGSCQEPSDDVAGWEFQTVPGSLGQALNQLHSLYPDKTNNSCGMHVHVSWSDPTDVTLFATQAFFDYFKARWTAWGTANQITPGSAFWRRLNGDNNFCQINRDMSDREITRMDRYHQLNFSSWGEHKTIECRLLPMFYNESLAISAVQELVSIYEDFAANANTLLTMPAADCRVDKPPRMLSKAKTTIEGAKKAQDKSVFTIEMTAIKPPAEGMVRTALAGGNFDLDMLKLIAGKSKAA